MALTLAICLRETHQQMFPVLHKEHIRLIHNKQLDGGKKVEISLALTIGTQNGSKTKWRRNDDVRGVEWRIETHSAFHNRHT